MNIPSGCRFCRSVSKRIPPHKLWLPTFDILVTVTPPINTNGPTTMVTQVFLQQPLADSSPRRLVYTHMDPNAVLVVLLTRLPDRANATQIFGLVRPFLRLDPPWHRAYLNDLEAASRTECNYRGTQSYWDWASGRVSRSISRPTA